MSVITTVVSDLASIASVTTLHTAACTAIMATGAALTLAAVLITPHAIKSKPPTFRE